MVGDRYIIAGSFIDGSGGDVRRNVFLAVKDSIITAIGSAADLSGNEGQVIDDFSHCTILPALVEGMQHRNLNVRKRASEILARLIEDSISIAG